MTTSAAAAIAAFVRLYLLIGLLVAAGFALRGAARIDAAAANGTWGFRLLIMPASALLWPLVLVWWIRGRSLGDDTSPVEVHESAP